MNNLVVSQDSRFLAYTIDTTGEELYNLSTAPDYLSPGAVKYLAALLEQTEGR